MVKYSDEVAQSNVFVAKKLRNIGQDQHKRPTLPFVSLLSVCVVCLHDCLHIVKAFRKPKTNFAFINDKNRYENTCQYSPIN